MVKRLLFLLLLSFILGDAASAAEINGVTNGAEQQLFPGVKSTVLAEPLKALVYLTLLSILPSLLVATTSFLRIIIVLSMLRHAIGMQDTPPNVALIGIGLFLTLFSMQPVFTQAINNAWQPFTHQKIDIDTAFDEAQKPFREFMLHNIKERDLQLMYEVSNEEPPEMIEDVSLLKVIPAFMLSELKTAFQIGFMIFLPFLLVDIIVASLLSSLGMMMVPPVTISLPLKVLMFILIDGWNLVVKSLMASFAL
ncbi:flagellar type III secretion system pore protein FliP [Methylophilus methylotrophus]|uniref:flagellar type III secretion system pore protein FliP n=1 Tax=Methylophilus methylotrophus TaxID=17 RepID=UPI000F593C99|nr:flagellar type III secretion system pore protein FliP [Methylophilus methylotrophus]